MEQSSKGVTCNPGLTVGADLWSTPVVDKLSNGISSGLFTAPATKKPAQPFNRGDEAYLYGVLSAMCAGHCRLKDVYRQVDHEQWQQKIVAGFETTSKKYVLIPIELPFQGSTILDDWFLELKARIVMECGE